MKKMKKNYLYIFLVVFFVNSCKNKENRHKVITSKSHLTFTNNRMPNGICRYFYRTGEWGDSVEFTDKCEKYNVGDNIVGTVRNYQ